jgi:hypothetical protein
MTHILVESALYSGLVADKQLLSGYVVWPESSHQPDGDSAVMPLPSLLLKFGINIFSVCQQRFWVSGV